MRNWHFHSLALLLALTLAVPCFAEDAEAADVATVDAEQMEEESAPIEEEETPADPVTPTQPDSSTDPVTPEQPDSSADPVTPEQPDSSPEEKADWISGRYSVETDAAWADGARDVDLDQTLRLKLDPRNHPNLHFYGLFWLHADLDGDEAQNSALYDIDNSYDHDVRLRLSHLYMQVDDLWGNSELRIGRQRIFDAPLYPRIDGVYFKQNNAQWDWYAFIGMRASLYEDAHNDLSTGLGVAWRPTARTKIALDFAYMKEESDEVKRGLIPRLFHWNYPYEIADEVDSTYLALTVHQAITDHVWAYARLTMYDDDPNEFILDFTGYAPGADLTYNFSYRRQMQRVLEQVNGLTVYYRELGSLETYDHFLASLHKQFSEKVAVSLESDLHISSSDEKYDNNRDYWRAAAALHLTQLRPGLDITLALERWDADRGSASWVLTGELSKNWGKWTWNVGADYEQYRDEIYNYNPRPEWLNQFGILFVPGIYSRPFTPLIWALDTQEIRTREEIHSIYTGVEYAVRENQKLSAKITYEDDDTDDSPYWRVQTSYAIDF